MLWKFGVMLVIALAIYFVPAPEGVDPRGMHMLAIFVATIVGLILQPLPTPAVSLIGLAAAMITGAMDIAAGEALSGFSNTTVLLIVAAFFIADGFLITGLGRRIALFFVGIAILLLTKVLTWKDMAKNASAWNTWIFFAVLVGMAENFNNLGVIGWVGDVVSGLVGGLPWMVAFAILTIVYFYAHYMFASNTAQIVAMYAVFLGAAVAAGAPPLIAALVLGFIGNLFGALTHFASGPSGVIYGSGYIKVSEWFRTAFIMSIVVIAIWTVSGWGWMTVLGMW